MAGPRDLHAAERATTATVITPAGSGRWRGLVLPVAAVALWWWLARLELVTSGLLVAPGKVLETAYEMTVSGRLWRALSASLAREFTGFAIGTTLGLVLGALLGLWPRFNRIVGPSFNTFKQISLFAWIPLISVWFGLGDVAKVVFLSLAALVPVVVLPSAIPSIFTGIYLALIYSWLATIGAEYLLVAGRGVGNLLIEGSEHFQMDLVIFGMAVIGLVGWLMNASARWLERRLARWSGRA